MTLQPRVMVRSLRPSSRLVSSLNHLRHNRGRWTLIVKCVPPLLRGLLKMMRSCRRKLLNVQLHVKRMTPLMMQLLQDLLLSRSFLDSLWSSRWQRFKLAVKRSGGSRSMIAHGVHARWLKGMMSRRLMLSLRHLLMSLYS